jgi:dipeptidyl aminopeptidase/acylaminoacyl peptidase
VSLFEGETLENNQENPGSSLEELEALVAGMARVGSCFSPGFSPDGERLAFVSDLGGVLQVWTVATGGGWPDLVTALEDPVGKVAWSPEGSRLAFSAAPGGGMNAQVYVVRPDGTGLRRLTDGGKENNQLDGWTPDGAYLMVSSNRRRGDAMDAYLLDPDGGFRFVAESPGIGNLTDVSRDGRWGVLYRMQSRGDSDLFLVDLRAGGEVLLTPHEGPGSFHSGRFSPDGRAVYLVSNEGRDLAAFARVKLSGTGEPGPIEVIAARDDAELESFALRRDGTEAALVWNVAGRSELAFVDLKDGRQIAGPPPPAEVVSGLSWSEDGGSLALCASGAATPMDVYVIQHPSGSARRVTRSPHAGVDLSVLARPRLVRFPSHDGLEVSGWLYEPPGAGGPWPTVLSFHGGPEGQERPAFKDVYQALLARGIAVFAPNVRGSSGFGKEFVNLDNGPLRGDAVRDIEACVKYVVGEGVAERGRVGIMGGSYGGYMTMAGLTEYPDLFAAGANLYGVVNFETFFANTEPWMAAISKVEYGDPETQAEMLRELSPIHKLDRVKAPTLVLHGANDTNVPVVEAEQVVEGLSERGVPVEYVLFPDEGHGFRKTENRIRAALAVVRWFVEHL